MTEPSYDEITHFLHVSGANLSWWQTAAVQSIAGAKGRATFALATGRTAGKYQADRWAMFVAHHFNQHTHFAAGDQYPHRPGICITGDQRCLEAGWQAYDPEGMKP